MKGEMNIVTVLSVALCLAACEARLDAAGMRKALNQSPLFSHGREKPSLVPMNVNINLPVGPDAGVPVAPPTRQTRPVKAESQGMRGNMGGVMKHQNRQDGPIAAGKPPQRRHVLGQKAPTPRGQIDRAVMRTAASKPINNEQANTKPSACSFNIPPFLLPNPNPEQLVNLRCPSFLLPSPKINPELGDLMVEHWTKLPASPKSSRKTLNKVRKQISQVEFEQKCLVPALRAYVSGGPACQESRLLTVYLEWLLYLRQRLFNI